MRHNNSRRVNRSTGLTTVLPMTYYDFPLICHLGRVTENNMNQCIYEIKAFLRTPRQQQRILEYLNQPLCAGALFPNYCCGIAAVGDLGTWQPHTGPPLPPNFWAQSLDSKTWQVAETPPLDLKGRAFEICVQGMRLSI